MKIMFELPGLPQSINAIGRKHWAIKNREARYWKSVVGLAVASQRPATPFIRAKAILTRFSSVEPDLDNLAGSFKHVLDGLTEARVILDDKPSVLSVEFKWVKAKVREGKISVEVWPL